VDVSSPVWGKAFEAELADLSSLRGEMKWGEDGEAAPCLFSELGTSRKFTLSSRKASGFFNGANEDINFPCRCSPFTRTCQQAAFGLPQRFPFVWFHSISFAIIFIHCVMNYAKPVLLRSLGRISCWLFQGVAPALQLYFTFSGTAALCPACTPTGFPSEGLVLQLSPRHPAREGREGESSDRAGHGGRWMGPV